MSEMAATMSRRDDGFTLIEMLVACLIVVVLVSIALPAFAAQTDRADGASAKGLVRTAETAIESHFVTAQSYDVTPAELVAIEPVLSGARSLEAEGTGEGYRIAAQDADRRTFGIERSASSVARFCFPAGEGGCPASGRW